MSENPKERAVDATPPPEIPLPTADGLGHPKKRAFFLAYARTGSLSMAAHAAECSRASHYRWMEADPEYARVIEEAKAHFIETLELEADRRARDGVTEPVYQGGALVGYRQRYSDTLLIFRLKALAPEKYRERTEQHTTLAGKVEINKPIHELSEDDLWNQIRHNWPPELFGKLVEIQEEYIARTPDVAPDATQCPGMAPEPPEGNGTR